MSKDNKDNGLVNGIILIAIGIIALMVTFFDLEIVWSELAKFWPVFVIIFGISILPLNKFLKSVFVIILILLSCILYYNNINDNTKHPASFSYDMIDDDVNVQEFSEPYNINVKTADVEINYGAGSLFLSSPVDYLVKATNASNYIMQDFSVIYDGNNAEINFEGGNDVSINGNDFKSNNFNIALNKNPIYDFEVNLGACDMNFDFSPYKVSNLEINSGACNIDIKLGDLSEFTDVVLATGVSDIRIGIPEKSGCRIKCESVLSNKNFDGFDKKSGSLYETSNYIIADKQINIQFEGAISDFEIYRY
ncbi:MAG: hypothetical protein J6R32_01685 [Bacteroidales bacterium]|nr:hypothetical protein [Bacteroidales bacterium]